MDDGEIVVTEKKGVGVNGNLIPPQKGEIRNPAGKPKGTRNRQTIIREILEAAAAEALKSTNKIDLGVEPKTIFEQLVLTQVVKASLGDTQAFKELADSGFGKVADKVENKHTFTQMGRVMVGTPDDVTGEVKELPLTFDVGEEPQKVEDEEDDPN